MRERVNRKREEILGILLMLLGILILLSLISYHPDDWPNSSDRTKVGNWLGLAGAWIAYYIFRFTIGYPALIIPPLIFLWGWNKLSGRDPRQLLRNSLYALFFSLCLSIAFALPEAISTTGSKYGYELSGLVGGFFAEHLHKYLGTIGSVLVLLTGVIIALISATNISLSKLCADLGAKLREMRKTREFRRKIKEKAEVYEVPEKPLESPEEEQEIKGIEEEEVREEESFEEPGRDYIFPSIDLLNEPHPMPEAEREDLLEKARFLEEKLADFDIRGKVVQISPGPVITRFEVEPAPGMKVSKFVNLADDLALVMRAPSIRIVAPIPGKAAIGIEIPNRHPSIVPLRSVMESEKFQKADSKLTLALGMTISGEVYTADLAAMPHLLIAGATGSGKSVCLHTIIASLLYRLHPTEIQFVMIDPKKLELTVYAKLKDHHLAYREDLDEEVVTSAANAISVLRSVEIEMDRRYELLARAGVRNIEDYNLRVERGLIPIEEARKLEYLVVIIDELADLMLVAAKEVEEPICRLAQMSRAVGIHLIVATQRPSVDVITGVIKANFPSRMAFQVASKADSRIILDMNGAEKLLGRGDMLFLPPGRPEPIRIHGAYISHDEIQRVVDHIARQPRFPKFKLPLEWERPEEEVYLPRGGRDKLFNEAAKLVVQHQQGSVSLLQRRLRIGYARAARLIDQLEQAGIVGAFDGTKAREVLVSEDELKEMGIL